MKTHLACTALIASVVFGLATPLTAQAQGSVLSGVLKNNTNIVVTYQVLVPGGSWRMYSLQPGQSRAHVLPYPSGVGKSIQIRFDNTLGDGKLTLTNTTIAMYSCAKPEQGWPQNFIRTNDGENLHLPR
ncbi:MAG: hypothetical protein K2R98_04380 [Gemmataceae bacterium]|nr:hypothetical protein [Gemmataceae bacterium]